MALKLKQKESRKEIIKCKEIYEKKIESHFKQGNMKETWSWIKKITGYSKPNSPLPSNLDSNELNQFYARLDTIDFSTETEDERMKLKVSKNVDECLINSENEMRKEFWNVNANKAKGSNGLTGKIFKTCASQLCHIYSHIFNLSLSTSSIPNICKTSKISPVPKKEKNNNNKWQDL